MQSNSPQYPPAISFDSTQADLTIKYENSKIRSKAGEQLNWIIHSANPSFIQSPKKKAPTVISLNLLNYNLFMRPPPIHSRGNDFKDERLTDILTKIANYDIICFQELFSKANKRRKFMCQNASKIGFKYISYVKTPVMFKKKLFPIIDSGLVILSKYPIIDTDFCRYQHACGADKMADKGCLYSKFFLNPNLSALVFNTHPQAGYGDYDEAVQIIDKDPKRYKKIIKTYVVRWLQIAEMSLFIERKLMLARNDVKGMKFIVLVMGDFNIDGRGPEIGVEV